MWLAAGFWTFMITMYHPTALPPLSDLAHAWLSLTVAVPATHILDCAGSRMREFPS